MLRRTSFSSHVNTYHQPNTQKTPPGTPPNTPTRSSTSDLRSQEKEDEVMADYYNESAETVEHPSAPDSSGTASHETVAVVGANVLSPAVNRQGDHQTGVRFKNPDLFKGVIQKF
jgi:hypothetical protein